ncbi:ribbon-helix-helix CopG family protein [Knoellia remsis]|uniref:Ribbon-helix-helix CopG family protein n=1 Tax=Knoellia remsis TaxID=407159 RepID=A0A2T0TWB6_9MICO|nr:ribbon-helix-helix protein, CopG family [Knoellia remsis]PRY49957.1 ribbon-helix-helix CopG family protein [Knoellia remsis]
MSTLERRIQLLLDQERYERVAAEAEKSGRSVNAVIREAIDVHYPSMAVERSRALGEFLARTAEPDPGEPETVEDVAKSLDERYTSSW